MTRAKMTTKNCMVRKTMTYQINCIIVRNRKIEVIQPPGPFGLTIGRRFSPVGPVHGAVRTRQ